MAPLGTMTHGTAHARNALSFLLSLSVLPPPAPSGLPAGSEALPPDSEALPAGFQHLLVGSQRLAAGSEPLSAGSELQLATSLS